VRQPVIGLYFVLMKKFSRHDVDYFKTSRYSTPTAIKKILLMSSRHPFDALHMRDCKIGPFQQLRFFFGLTLDTTKGTKQQSS